MVRVFCVCLTFLIILIGCGQNKMETELNQFIETHLAEVQPIMKGMNLSYWNAYRNYH